MKIAIFSDIHSNFLVFNKAYNDALSKSADIFLFLGDYITDGFDANKVIEIIKESKGFAINGNRELSIIDYHKTKDENWDKYIQYKSMQYAYKCLNNESLAYIESLPMYKIITVMNKKICMAHGTPYNVRNLVSMDDYDIFEKLIEDFNCDVYLFAHTHIQFYTEYKGKYFINAGSIGFPVDGMPFKYGMLNIDSSIEYESIEVDYDYEELKNYYKNSDYYKEAPIWCSLLLELLKKGENHTQQFIDYTIKKAKESNIDISIGIPNELFMNSYNEYMDMIKK